MTIYKQLASKPRDPAAADEFEEYFSDEEDRAQVKNRQVPPKASQVP